MNSFIRYLTLFFAMFIFLFGAKVEERLWKNNYSFEDYLKEHNISIDIIESLDSEDMQLISEIRGNRKFCELVASNGVLLQALIPIGEELELHLFKMKNGYKLEIIPIEYKVDTFIAIVPIERGPYLDIIKETDNIELANEFINILKHNIDFKQLHEGDKLAVVYNQKMRLGRAIGFPDIKVAMVNIRGLKYYVFKYLDGKYYNGDGHEIEKRYMCKPLKILKISSPFTYRRYHPILHKYRAHLGVDFKADRGTPIFASDNGVIIFAGELGGYGNVVKIRHLDNYITLYAHQSKINVKVKDIVKKGDIIGFVGSTGRSTGPHLHFGVYINGRAVDPMQMIKEPSISLSKRDKVIFFRRKKRYINIINKIFEKNMPSYILKSSKENLVSPDMKSYYKKLGW